MLTLKLGQKPNIPMIVTNHTYDVIGAYVLTKEMGGGSNPQVCSKYNHLSLSKRKRKMELQSSEILSRFKTAKSRLSKENKDVHGASFIDERV